MIWESLFYLEIEILFLLSNMHLALIPDAKEMRLVGEYGCTLSGRVLQVDKLSGVHRVI